MSHIIKHDVALNFIFGGNSIFTCRNTKTGNRFTFKVTKHKKEDVYFVKVLTNPDVYEFIGSIRKESAYKHSPKSRISTEAQSVRVFDFLVNKLRTNTLPEFVEIWHEGRCAKCGKTLTDPESIKLGFGPFCLRTKSSSPHYLYNLYNP